jgi:hypothetical protein
MAESGDGCDSFSFLFGITLQALVTWDPVLGANGANCQTLSGQGITTALDSPVLQLPPQHQLLRQQE